MGNAFNKIHARALPVRQKVYCSQLTRKFLTCVCIYIYSFTYEHGRTNSFGGNIFEDSTRTGYGTPRNVYIYVCLILSRQTSSSPYRRDAIDVFPETSSYNKIPATANYSRSPDSTATSHRREKRTEFVRSSSRGRSLTEPVAA